MPQPSPPRARDLPIPPMDHGSGDKASAFTWAMGELILLRVADGETMKAITADPRMPAYCTVYQWMRVVPEFGAAAARLRQTMAQARVADRRLRRGLARAEDGRQAPGERSLRPRTRGSCSAKALGRVLARIRAGASIGEATAVRGAPSVTTVYRRLETCPGFRIAFVDACRWRDSWLALQADIVGDDAWARGDFAAADIKVAKLEERRGRLTPRVYRASRP